MRTAALGLLTMIAGCLRFILRLLLSLGLFLFALFILAAGITIVQVVANPLITQLGEASTAHIRLTFAQAFNSLGTPIFPYAGSILILENGKHDILLAAYFQPRSNACDAAPYVR